MLHVHFLDGRSWVPVICGDDGNYSTFGEGSTIQPLNGLDNTMVQLAIACRWVQDGRIDYNHKSQEHINALVTHLLVHDCMDEDGNYVLTNWGMLIAATVWDDRCPAEILGPRKSPL